MKLHERLARLESEVRILCANFKNDANITKDLIKELRLYGFLALARWEQNNHCAEILAWKYGTAAAIRFRDGEEYMDYLIEDLNAIIHEKQPERAVLRLIVDPHEVSTPEEIGNARLNGCIVIKPGDLMNSPPLPEPQTTGEPANEEGAGDESLPF